MASTSKQIASTGADVSAYWDNSAWQLMTDGNNMVMMMRLLLRQLSILSIRKNRK